ncbi:hypothetical protein M407DRAFT_81401 [Tulasnella calospora MUT 4182]|uniref:Protein kinase domain-containing protein n=1 Tax=Tulasnella calospora MUT 4182 TaxID=1051891 RepID=A0A0C3LGJ6_9AGAM|nr:hypothetical protein M407DRAFT_81401 [Tulasnella calospora MUT 4182]
MFVFALLIPCHQSFVNELSIRTALSHPNIAQFIGFVEDAQKGDAWIVSPWEENGNVREFLQHLNQLCAQIRDVGEGVDYLHTRQPPICHGDLKSLNILVNSSFRAVITDFGSARIKPHLDAMKEDKLTLTDAGFSIRWTAPEVLDDGVQDLPSDMWAVGWICWEIVTGKIPFEELDRQGAIIAHVVKGKLPAIREENELSDVLTLCNLMSNCWIGNPTKRIDASNFRRKVSWAVSPSLDKLQYILLPELCTSHLQYLRDTP